MDKEYCGKREIESQLLIADKSKVACIFEEKDLDDIIQALEGYRDVIGILNDNQESMIRDLNELKKVTFHS